MVPNQSPASGNEGFWSQGFRLELLVTSSFFPISVLWGQVVTLPRSP